MFNNTTVARPYAKAAFEYANDKNLLDHWVDMMTFATSIVQDCQFKNVLTSEIKPKRLADLFIAICGEKLDEAGRNFISVLADYKRLYLLPDILKLFILLVADKKSIKTIDIITADILDNMQKDKISKAMQQRLSCKVKLNCSVDKSIIAGIIIRTDDMVIDGSILGRLQRLTDKLLA